MNNSTAEERSEAVVLWKGDHKFVWLGVGDPEKEKGFPSSQYLIVDKDVGYLLDPGGYHVFDRTYDNITKFIPPENIKGLSFSHQDPDVIVGLVSWLGVAPNAQVIVSKLWERFLPHLPLPQMELPLFLLEDEGTEITLPSGGKLHFIPAHFLHSCGNFVVYDSLSRTLFSGDIGTALLPSGRWYQFVDDFEEHVTFMEGFHRRYLGSTKALKAFLKRLEGVEIEMICPQHGPIFRGEKVGQFLEWLDSLEVGADYLF